MRLCTDTAFLALVGGGLFRSIGKTSPPGDEVLVRRDVDVRYEHSSLR